MTNALRRKALLLTAAAAGLLSAGAPASGPPSPAEPKAQEARWSAKKLPGSTAVHRHIAVYYRPTSASVQPTVPEYKLPLDLSQLTNKDFAEKMPELRDQALAAKAKEALARNGFVVLDTGRQDDVTAFYKGVLSRGLPLFITSDSLLHLCRVYFSQALRGAEQRKLFDEAALIAKAIQTEALRLHDDLTGELKAAARLLVGYSTVPVVLLHQADLGEEARKALREVYTWTDQPNWRQAQMLQDKYGELLPAIARETRVRLYDLLHNKKALVAALERYIKVHPRTEMTELIPAICRDEVQHELALIEAHKGVSPSPLFLYRQDYSQFAPRGHYAASKKLRQYFKALTWYGRMTFLIRGGNGEKIEGLVPMAEARKQTLAAAILGAMMGNPLPDGRTLSQAWNRLYGVTAYFVGAADDLTPYDYREALRGSMGETFSPSALTNPARFFEMRKLLARMRKPGIYGGLGDVQTPPAMIASEKMLAEALPLTQGLRLIGRRYAPDSYILGRLVHPTVGAYTGRGKPFTLVRGADGPIRGFPRGLDVLAVLGSKRARHWLKQLGDDAYGKYDETLAALSKKIGEIDRAAWNRNLYWSWLYVLRTLLAQRPKGYPTFMQTDAWQDKQLSEALASWSQLRHDTVAYVKQSYTRRRGDGPPRPKKVGGYIEPAPHLYLRLYALLRMARYGLRALGLTTDPYAYRRLYRLNTLCYQLYGISLKELSNQRLTPEDYALIHTFADEIKSVMAHLSREALATTMAADVHTDSNTRQVLVEATGYLHAMIVVYPMPDGKLVAGVGPVLSHYEFKHPLSSRLTDEAWKRLVRLRSKVELPSWAKTYTVSSPRRSRLAPRTKAPPRRY